MQLVNFLSSTQVTVYNNRWDANKKNEFELKALPEVASCTQFKNRSISLLTVGCIAIVGAAILATLFGPVGWVALGVILAVTLIITAVLLYACISASNFEAKSRVREIFNNLMDFDSPTVYKAEKEKPKISTT